MGLWDITAGLGEAVDPARQWLETVYRIKSHNAQQGQAANDAALKGVLDLGGRGAIREAAYEKMRKPKEGKGFSLDKFPFQNMSEAYRQEERDPTNILSAVGSAQSAYGQNLTDRAGTEFNLQRPGMLDARSEPAPAEDADVNRLFRQTAVQPSGQMVGKPRASLADVSLNQPDIGAADITQTLATKTAQARKIAQPVYDAQNAVYSVASSPEDEALINARLKAIDAFPDLRPEVRTVLKQSILAQAAKAKEARSQAAEAQRQAAIGDASTRVYREQYPERKVPALAERVLAEQKTAAEVKGSLEKELARIRQGATYARLNFDQLMATDAKQAVADTQTKVKGMLDELDNLAGQYQGNDNALAQIRDTKEKMIEQYGPLMVAPALGGTKNLGPLITGLKPTGRGGAGGKPKEPKPSMETNNAVRQIGALDRVFAEGSASEKATAQAERNRLIDIVNQQMPGQYKKTYKYVTLEEREKLSKQGKTPEQYESWMLKREGG